MTERGRHPRWTAAVLLAPASAAVFAGSTAWANDHDPAAVKQTAAAQIAGRTEEVRKLRVEVAELRDRVAGLQARADGASSSTAPKTKAPAATPKTAAPAAAPAPATQTTTGGS